MNQMNIEENSNDQETTTNQNHMGHLEDNEMDEMQMDAMNMDQDYQNNYYENSEEDNQNYLMKRQNYSCIEFDNSNMDKSENLSLNYLYNVLIHNNVSEEEIRNLNNYNPTQLLKSFSEKAILSRKLNYSVNDFSRFLLEKNDLQILIDLLSNNENQQNTNSLQGQEDYDYKDHQNHQQSIEDFTSLLAGGKKKLTKGKKLIKYLII